MKNEQEKGENPLREMSCVIINLLIAFFMAVQLNLIVVYFSSWIILSFRVGNLILRRIVEVFNTQSNFTLSFQQLLNFKTLVKSLFFYNQLALPTFILFSHHFLFLRVVHLNSNKKFSSLLIVSAFLLTGLLFVNKIYNKLLFWTWYKMSIYTITHSVILVWIKDWWWWDYKHFKFQKRDAKQTIKWCGGEMTNANLNWNIYSQDYDLNCMHFNSKKTQQSFKRRHKLYNKQKREETSLSYNWF